MRFLVFLVTFLLLCTLTGCLISSESDPTGGNRRYGNGDGYGIGGNNLQVTYYEKTGYELCGGWTSMLTVVGGSATRSWNPCLGNIAPVPVDSSQIGYYLDPKYASLDGKIIYTAYPEEPKIDDPYTVILCTFEDANNIPMGDYAVVYTPGNPSAQGQFDPGAPYRSPQALSTLHWVRRLSWGNNLIVGFFNYYWVIAPDGSAILTTVLQDGNSQYPPGTYTNNGVCLVRADAQDVRGTAGRFPFFNGMNMVDSGRYYRNELGNQCSTNSEQTRNSYVDGILRMASSTGSTFVEEGNKCKPTNTVLDPSSVQIFERAPFLIFAGGIYAYSNNSTGPLPVESGGEGPVAVCRSTDPSSGLPFYLTFFRSGMTPGKDFYLREYGFPAVSLELSLGVWYQAATFSMGAGNLTLGGTGSTYSLSVNLNLAAPNPDQSVSGMLLYNGTQFSNVNCFVDLTNAP